VHAEDVALAPLDAVLDQPADPLLREVVSQAEELVVDLAEAWCAISTDDSLEVAM